MIRLVLGNVGSGKTASTVRWMKTRSDRTIITNIGVKGKDFKHVIKLQPEMILLADEKGKLKLNVEYWKDLVVKYKKIIVVIDEAHTFFNPRRSMSKLNVVMTDFLALLRRVLGSSDNGGELVLITQLSRRLDVIAKEMSNYVQYCVHHYKVSCSKCKLTWNENNEMPLKRHDCPRCKSFHINNSNHVIEVWEFRDVEEFEIYKRSGIKSYFRHYIIKDIHKIFGNYETLQWDDLLSHY